MATKRSKRTRNRVGNMPEWVRRFKETGKPPQRGEPGWDDYLAWKFFGDSVPGLSDAP
jgi:hypothetical protein